MSKITTPNYKPVKIFLFIIFVWFFVIFVIMSSDDFNSSIHYKIIQRKRVINATPEYLFHYLNNLKQWERWSYFHKNIPKSSFRYKYEETIGEGSICNWESSSLGWCLIYVDSIIPYKEFNVGLNFEILNSAKNPHGCNIKFLPIANGTEVVMTMESNERAEYEGETTDIYKPSYQVELNLGYDLEMCLQGLDSVASYDKKIGL